MRVLFDLIHSLSKDEKRLYNLHKRKGRFQKIYDAYVAAGKFDKAIDRRVYQKEFSDVSKPFYSMQKRSLFDDIVTVLLSYSNLQDPVFKLSRSLAKSQILLSRQNIEAAKYYLKEAMELATSGEDPVLQLLVVRLQLIVEESEKEGTFAAYEQLMNRQKALIEEISQDKSLKTIKQALYLLKENRDKLSPEERKQKAQHYMSAAQQIEADLKPADINFERLEVDALYAEITSNLVGHHKELVALYKQVEKEELEDKTARYFHLLNLVLRSALRVGDFLMLSGLIYKTNKLLEYTPEDIRVDFLPDYLETCALYHYYENELQTAIEEIERVLELPNADEAQIRRCTMYHIAFLIAANLQEKAGEELNKQEQKHKFLQGDYNSIVFRVLIAVDLHQDADEISLNIDRYKNELRKQEDTKAYIDCLQMIQNFLEKKTVRLKEVKFLDQDWENVMRVDLWLSAKMDNKFYYNLMTDAWQQRKQVFT